MAAFLITVFLVTITIQMTKAFKDEPPLGPVYELMEKLDETCGLFDMEKQQSAMERVVGGVDASVVPPWMVRISVQFNTVDPKKRESEEDELTTLGYLTKDDDGNREAFRHSISTGLCGGSIIDEYNVVTAAHCFDEDDGEKFVAVDIDFGGRSFVDEDTWKMSNKTTKGRFYPKRGLHGILPKNVIQHEDYDKSNNNYDIAIIKLPFRINLAQTPDDEQTVRHVCLPDPHDLKKKYIDTKKCYVTGWGRLCEKGPKPEALQQAKMSILDDDICKQKFKALNASYDKNIKLCAGGDLESGERSTCKGDSGGPLHCRKKVGAETKWVLMGIVSGGAGPCGTEEMPIKFTRVSYFRDWICEKKKNSAEVRKEIFRRNLKIKKKYTMDRKYRPDKDDDNNKEHGNEQKEQENPSNKKRPASRRPRKHRPLEYDDEHEPDPEPDQEPESEQEPRPRRKRPVRSKFSGGNQIIITNNNNNNLNQNLDDSLSGDETTTKQL